MAGEAAVQVAPVPQRGRGIGGGRGIRGGRLLHGRQARLCGPMPEPRARPGTPAQPARAAEAAGATAPRPLLWVQLRRRGPAEHPDRRREMGAPSSALLGAGGGGPDSRLKFPGPRGSPPDALLSGVGGREAAPQRREPGAASAQRLRPRPTDGGSRAFPADLFVVLQPPNPAAGVECSDLSGHRKALGPFINSPHFLSRTMRTSRLAKRLGAEDPEVSGNPLSHPQSPKRGSGSHPTPRPQQPKSPVSLQSAPSHLATLAHNPGTQGCFS